MILGGVNFGTTFFGLYVVEHFGRRKSLVTGGIWMFVNFMVFASVGHFSLNVEDPSATPGAGKAMVVFACLFITGEIYPILSGWILHCGEHNAYL
jgi:SP family sugar:H+ symporter-like MFS transporter